MLRHCMNFTHRLVKLAALLHLRAIKSEVVASDRVVTTAGLRVQAHDITLKNLQTDLAQINDQIILTHQERTKDTTHYIQVFDAEKLNQRGLADQARVYEALVA